MNEAETRAEHIDKQLAAAGWGVVEGNRIRREHPITPGRIEGLGRRGKSFARKCVADSASPAIGIKAKTITSRDGVKSPPLKLLSATTSPTPLSLRVCRCTTSGIFGFAAIKFGG